MKGNDMCSALVKFLRTVVVVAALGGFFSSATAQTPLIPKRSVWKYLDDGSDQMTAWRDPGFNDGAWVSGPGPLGYGDPHIATTVSFGGNAAQKYITTYFRKSFEVTGGASVSVLRFEVLRDDGVVVYLDGNELFRMNMPAPDAGDVTYLTQAIGTAVGGADETNYFATNIVVGPLSNGPHLLAVEVHQNGAGSSDLGFDIGLTANPANVPPTPTIITPANNAVLAQANITFTASATDSDGTVASVQFLANNGTTTTPIGTDTSAPYGLIWTGVTPGNYTLTAVATDDKGARGTSAPVRITVSAPPNNLLIPFGATWKYYDLGEGVDSFWTSDGFNDASWASGPAQLGFGDGDEATVVTHTNDVGLTNITYYFRRAFTVANPATVTSLLLQMQRDDGAVAYINGNEVFRSNLGPEPVAYSTFATAAVDGFTELAGTRIDTVLNPVLQPGNNVLAVEIHQATLTSSDISFDAQLRFNVPASGPTVLVVSPTNNNAFTTSDTITLGADAFDVDGSVTNIEFRVDGQSVGNDGTLANTSPGFSVTTSLASGSHTITAIATDDTGATSTSAPITVTVTGPNFMPFVPQGSVWKYLDDGSDQGTAWREPAFNDSSWMSGPGPLGYGDTHIITTVMFGPDTNAKHITTYFRREFNVTSASQFGGLRLRLLRDDGAVVYLNGTEVWRANMPQTGDILFTTGASANVGGADETTYFVSNVVATALREGRNVLAVESHQDVGTSSDLGMDLAVDGLSGGTPPLRLSIRRDGNDVVLSWSATGVTLVQADNVNSTTWTPVPGAAASPFRIAGGALAPKRFFRLRQP